MGDVVKAPVKITSVTHGAVDLGSVKRIRVQETVDTLPLIGSGTTSGPAARPIVSQDIIAEITSQEPDDYVAAGTSATLTVNFREANGSTTGAIAITTMIRTNQEWSHENNTGGEHTITFEHVGAMASTPVTVT